LVLIGLFLSSLIFLFPRKLGVTWVAFIAIRRGMSEDEVRTIIEERPRSLDWASPIAKTKLDLDAVWTASDGSAITVHFHRLSSDSDFSVYQKGFNWPQGSVWNGIRFVFLPSPVLVSEYRLRIHPFRTGR
jgi:hypothetical protein